MIVFNIDTVGKLTLRNTDRSRPSFADLERNDHVGQRVTLAPGESKAFNIQGRSYVTVTAPPEVEIKCE